MGSHNHKAGLALLWVIGLTMAIGGVLTYVTLNTTFNDKSNRDSRAKLAMAESIKVLYEKLSRPSSYNCVPKQDRAPDGTFPNCNLIPAFKVGIERVVSGAKCAPGIALCGIIINSSSLIVNEFVDLGAATPNSHIRKATANLTLVFNGTNSKIKPVTISYEIPPEVLAASGGGCPSTAPLLKGTNPDGSLNCVALPTDCAEGNYVVGYNANNHSYQCRAVFAAGMQFNCPSGSFVSTVSWDTNGNVVPTCVNSVSPCNLPGYYCP